MAKTTKTINKKIEYRKPEYFVATQELFNQVAKFYFGIIQEHQYILELDPQLALREMEIITVQTKNNPQPAIPFYTLTVPTYPGHVP